MPCQLSTCVPEVLSCVVFLTCFVVHCGCEIQDVGDNSAIHSIHRYKRSSAYGEEESTFKEPGVIIGIIVGAAGVLVVVGVSIFLCKFLCCRHTSCCSCCPCGDKWEMHDIQESGLVPAKGARDDSSPTHSVNSALDNGAHPRQAIPKSGRPDKSAITTIPKPPDYYDEFPPNTRKPKGSKKNLSKGSEEHRDAGNVGDAARDDARYDSDEADHSPRFFHTAVSKRKARDSEGVDDDNVRNSPSNDRSDGSDEARQSPKFLHTAVLSNRKPKEESGPRFPKSGASVSSLDSSDRDKNQPDRRGKPRGPNLEKLKHRHHQNYDNEPPRRDTGGEPSRQDTGRSVTDSQPSYETACFDELSEFNQRKQETSYNLNSSYPISVISDFNELAPVQFNYSVDPYQGGHFNAPYYPGRADLDERSGVDLLPPLHQRHQNPYNPQNFFNPVPSDRTDSIDRDIHPTRADGYGRDQTWNSSDQSSGRDSGNPSRTRPNKPRPTPRSTEPIDSSGATSVSSDRRKPACAVRLFSGAENLAFKKDSTETSV